MELQTVTEVASAIRREKRRRIARLLRRKDNPEIIDEAWREQELPFLNELSLMLIVAIHHEVERQLIALAARFTGDGKPLTLAAYRRRLGRMRRAVRKHGKTPLISALGLERFSDWNEALRTLQLLSDCLKHSPSQTPDRRLLKHLQLSAVAKTRPKVTYASIPESPLFCSRLAFSLGLPESADYADIATEFARRSLAFLAAVRKDPGLSDLTGPVSLIRFVG